MKFKYFMRGLGVGILFCTLIIFAAYQTSPNKLLTDEEVKTRAKELGMVEADTQLDKVLQGDSGTEDSQTTEDPVSKEGATSISGSNTPDEAATEQAKTTEDNKATEQPKTTEDKKTTEQPKTTEDKKTTEQPKTTEDSKTTEQTKSTEASTEKEVITATITVKKGMQSSTVAKELEKKGIIESASDFDNYLNKNGYSTKICVGTYSVKSSDSYETLAKILMKKK